MNPLHQTVLSPEVWPQRQAVRPDLWTAAPPLQLQEIYFQKQITLRNLLVISWRVRMKQDLLIISFTMAAKRIWQAEQGPTEALLISPKQIATVLSLCNAKSNASDFTYWLQSPLVPALLPPGITPAPRKPRGQEALLSGPQPQPRTGGGVRAASTSFLSLFPTHNIYPVSHINDIGRITTVPGVSCTAPGTISSLLLNGTWHYTSRWVKHTLNQSKKSAWEGTKPSI